MHTLLLGKIGQGITQDSGQEPRAKTFWGKGVFAVIGTGCGRRWHNSGQKRFRCIALKRFV